MNCEVICNNSEYTDAIIYITDLFIPDKTRKGMMNMTEQEMMDLFAGGFDCSQVAFVSAADKLGIDREEALKLSAAFGGGMYAGETCGAVTGSLMAIGYKYGHYKSGDAAAKETLIAKVKEFREAFCEENGSTMCRELLGYNIGDPEELEIILEENIMLQKCPMITASAVQILEEML